MASNNNNGNNNNGNTNTVKLRTSDGLTFEVAMKVARLSGLLNHIIDQRRDKTHTITLLRLNNVDSKTLHKVLEYCEQHANAGSDADQGLIKKWEEEEYIKGVDMDMLNLIIDAANSFRIMGLVELGCRTLTNRLNSLRGKKPEEIWELLGFKEDFITEEEEEDDSSSNKEEDDSSTAS